MPSRISLIVPVYNDAESIEAFFARVEGVIGTIPDSEFEIVCVNDGSTDDSLERLLARFQRDARVKVLDFSRNFGKEAAITAGIDEATGDAVIPIDVDLQDPPEVIPDLVARWREGYEMVLARRADRSTDSLLKRKSAHYFYKVHNAVADSRIPEDVGDFRLIDRKVVDALRRLPERHRFMKGLFSWVGFRTAVVDYRRSRRAVGRSAFTGWKLWNLALEGITSFSTAPLRIWTYLGATVSLAAFAYMLFIVTRTLAFGIDLPGYASLLATVLFLGGVQLIGIGVLGEYIGRTYQEVKARPTYIVRARYARQDPV